jgi:hypothetical protein
MRYETHDLTEEEGAPTPERARIANGSLHRFPVYENPNSRVIVGYGHQVATPVRKMLMDGRIGETECRAAEKYVADYEIGMRVAGLTAKYGKRMGVGGTPLSQMTASAFDELLPEELRADRHNSFVRAYSAIGNESTAFWVTAITCEIPVGGKVPTLADAGRAYMGYACPKQSQSSGATIIRWGLERLADHYGMTKKKKS